MITLTKTTELKIEDTSIYSILDNISNYYSHIEKILYNYLSDKEITNELWKSLKSQYILKYGIPGRLFNAIYTEVKGKIDGAKEIHQQSLKDAENRVKGLKDKIKKRERKIKTDNKLTKEMKDKLWLSIFQWKQKIDRLHQYINFHKPTRILFGTKDFYKKQWTLEEYKTDHGSWLKEWKRRRDYHFSLIGSKDESNGNQLCQYYQKNEKEFLQVRLPNALIEKYGKYINFGRGKPRAEH